MEGEKLKIKMSKKTVSYYLVNKQYKKEFEQLMNQCEKMYRKNYYEILRYCKKRNGEIVNLQFGEKFSLKFIALFDKARKEAEKNYKVKLGFANSNGFYMCDLSSFGIYSSCFSGWSALYARSVCRCPLCPILLFNKTSRRKSRVYRL